MAKNSGLGRGLDALFSESAVLKEMEKTSTDGEIVKNIKIALRVEPNWQRHPKHIMQSIKRMQPIM